MRAGTMLADALAIDDASHGSRENTALESFSTARLLRPSSNTRRRLLDATCAQLGCTSRDAVPIPARAASGCMCSLTRSQ